MTHVCKKVLSLLAVFSIILSMVPVYAADTDNTEVDLSVYTDLYGHWAEDALVNAVQNGIMSGTSETTISPDSPITRAQMATLLVNVFEAKKTSNISTFVDVKRDAWYYHYLEIAVQMGIIAGNGNAMRPNAHITRQEAACVLYQAFNLKNYTGNLSQFPDESQVASYAKKAFAACVQAGVLLPIDGELQPLKELTRADFVYALYSTVQSYISSRAPFSNASEFNSVMVTVSNISISNITVDKNMYIGDGVDTGNIIFDNVKINGTLYVRGGSEISLTNNSYIGNVIICNPSNSVSIVTDATSKVDLTTLDTVISGVTLSGSLGKVYMNTSKAALNLKDATIDLLDVNVVVPTIVVDKDSVVRDVHFSDAASGCKLTNEGFIRNLDFTVAEVDYTSTAESNVSKMSILCNKGKYSINGNIDDLSLGEDASDNKITFNSGADVGEFKIDSLYDNEITVSSGAELTEILFKQANSKVATTLKASDVRVTNKALKSKFTFNKGSSITELVIDADDVSIVVDKDASISTIIVNGKDVTITGKGRVGKVLLKKGATGADIDTANTKVENESGGSASLGGTSLSSGSTGTLDGDGKYKDETVEKPNTSKPDTSKPDTSKPDTSKPSVSKPVDSKFYLEFPGNASPLDLYKTGQYSLADIVMNGSYNQNTNQISGTVRSIVNFLPMLGNSTTDDAVAAEHYFPLVLRSSDRTDDFTLTVGGRVFTSKDLSVGEAYKGQLIFYVPLNQTAESKKIDISYDADGAGEKFNPAILTLDFETVQFESNTEITNRMMTVKAADGIGGAKALTLSGLQVISDTKVAYKLVCDKLIKTSNSDNLEGYWGGVIVYGPNDAMLVSYTVETNKGSQDFNTGLTLQDNKVFFTFYQNMEGIEFLNLKVRWRNEANEIIGAEEIYAFDTSGIVLYNPKPEDLPTAYIADSIIISAADAEFLRSEYGKEITEFADGYNVINNSGGSEWTGAIAGTYKYVVLDTSTGRLPGVYVPLSVIIMGLKAPAQLRSNNSLLGEITAPDGNYEDFNASVQVLVPVANMGSQISDFDLSVNYKSSPYVEETVKYITVTKSISAAEAAFVEEKAGLNGANGGEFCGVKFEDLVSKNYCLVKTDNTYSLQGIYKKVTIGKNVELADSTGWFAPVFVKCESADKPWVVEVTYMLEGSDVTETVKWDLDVSIINMGILLPLGFVRDSGEVVCTENITIQVKTDEGELIKDFSVSVDGVGLESVSKD